MKKWLLLVVLLIGFTCPPSQALAVETQTSGEISFEVEQPVNQPSQEQIKPKQQVNVPPPTKEDQLPALGMIDPTACELNRATTGVADATDFADKTI
ncbi:extracellular protein [Lacticaseibacillus rhamnosus MTCC 5462]|nr:extracellular protein [Lacticaseibacillus rhamnosus MTCC 5462]